jgi:uncharacterized protein YbjT (DUF2867 family)
MPDQTTILVTGASGRTGRAVISALQKHDVKIKAYIRREEVAEELKTLGADEIALGDLFDFNILEEAVAGCSHVIHICPPMDPRETELAKKITDFSLKNGVSRLLLYSVLHPLLSEVRHHNLKLRAEEYLVNSGQVYTILQPGRYMQHHVPIWKDIMETGKHRMPFSVDAKFNIVDLADLAEAVANVATTDGHDSATYQLAGPQSLSQIDMARIISEATRKSIIAEPKPVHEFRAGAKKNNMPADRIEQLCIMNEHYNKHGLKGNSNVLEWILDRPATNFATYIKKNLA